MELKDVLELLEKSNEFTGWRKERPSAFLAHAFVMLDEANKDTWQIGYFDQQKNLMTTFIISGSIEIIPDQEVMKADNQILPLDPDKAKISVSEALSTAEKTLAADYPKEKPAKTFFIIQNIHAHGTVFNITFFTAGFRTINIKIDAADGKIVHKTCQALATFG